MQYLILMSMQDFVIDINCNQIRDIDSFVVLTMLWTYCDKLAV